MQNDIQHTDIQQNNKKNRDTQHNDIQYNGTCTVMLSVHMLNVIYTDCLK